MILLFLIILIKPSELELIDALECNRNAKNNF